MLTICFYLRILNLSVLLNDGASLYTQLKSTVSPNQFDTSHRKFIV